MYMEKHVLRQSMEWKHTDSPVKEKFWAQWSLERVKLTVFWDMKGPMIIDFLENGETINSGSYNQHLKQNSHYLLNDTYIYIYTHIYI